MTGEPNALAALGLPPSWAPAPLTFAVAKLELRNGTNASPLHVLRIDTPYGVAGYALDNEAARTLRDALTEQLTGIEVARTLPPNNNGGKT